MTPDPLESALNEHSCALACLVSLCREYGANSISQKELIEGHKKDITEWNKEPGSLTPYQFISFSRSYLKSKAHIWVEFPEWIIKYWTKKERIGGIIISQRQPVTQSQNRIIQHSWRILDVHEKGMKLMNPIVGKAEEKDVDWNFLIEWKAYALFIER